MLKALLLPIALLVAACSPPASGPAAKSDMSQMKMEEPAATPAAGPIRGTGTVTAVNAAQGVITLNHEPIPAIRWSAMTMEFKAEDPRILQGVAVGDRVTFELKSASDTNMVTMVQKQ